MIKESPDDMSVGGIDYHYYDKDAHCFTVFPEFNISIISTNGTHNSNAMFLADFINSVVLNNEYSHNRIKEFTQKGFKLHYIDNNDLERFYNKYPDIYKTYSNISSALVHSELDIIEGRYWDKDIPAVSFYNNISQISEALSKIERLVFYPLHIIKDRLVIELWGKGGYRIVKYTDIKNFSGTSSDEVDLMRKQHLDPSAKEQLNIPKNSIKAQEVAQQRGFNSAAQLKNFNTIGDSFNFKEYFKRHYTLLK